jgi:hypothetical protein
MDGFTGPQGSKARELTAMLTHGRPYFITTAILRPSEGLTIVVGWPKGFIEKPSASRPVEEEKKELPKPFSEFDILTMPGADKVALGEALIIALVIYT